ncbi:cysteine--tRNA ligase [Patescibacteria group bacterium]|nr:cysteine--tRNA ligase [Patescibacteria group bacterium]
MVLKIYNTLSRKKESFKPIKEGEVNLFVCGPTVYNSSHLGHAKTYVQFDVIVKFLRFKGYKVKYIQNITNIDDKIILKAKEEGLGEEGWEIVSERYEKSYLEDMKKLNVNSVNKYAKATNYMGQIISQVNCLIKMGYAYQISDGWYFDLSKCKDYGKLAKRTSQKADDAVSRIDENKEKKNKGDFCLWKFSKKGEPKWETKIGEGRPGWHIEDTAITEKEFGPQYDVHGGGIDLIFPHHEAEIAQMESISGKKPLVKYWLHTGFLEIDKGKMSKSKGNFYGLKEIMEKGYNPLHLRYLFLLGHYKKPLNFSWESLNSARNAYEKLKNNLSKIKSSKSKINQKNVDSVKKQFIQILDDDFNVPRALSYLWDILREEKLNDSEKFKIITEFDKVFDLDLSLDKEEIQEVPSEILKLAKERDELRKNKKFKESDEIRDKINKQGFVVEDSEAGSVIKKRGGN